MDVDKTNNNDDNIKTKTIKESEPFINDTSSTPKTLTDMYNDKNSINYDDIRDDDLADTQLSIDARDIKNESIVEFILQSLFPLLISGIGLICSGLLLDKWQNSKFYRTIHEAFILTPALLGLKGNIEMTFASRLATLAHQGKLDSKNDSKSKIIIGNMSLIQLQSIVISFFASILTIITITIKCEFHLNDSIIMTTSAIISTSLSSILLGFIIISLVIVSRKYKINPDNVMAPIAASFGDFITFLIFIGSGTALLMLCSINICFVTYVIFIIYILTIPIWIFISYKNEYTNDTLKYGWISIGIAAIISSIGGYILERSVIKYQNLALFQPLMCGLAGNRVAVQCSRLSTYYNTNDIDINETFLNKLNPINTFKCNEIHSRTANILIIMAIPSHLIFISIIIFINNNINFKYQFILSYLFAAFIQIVLLMYICQLLVYILWKIKIDPDHGAIPILTSFSDLMGTSLLYFVFLFLENTSPETIGNNKDLTKQLNKTGACL